MVQLASRSLLSTDIRRARSVIVCFGLVLTQMQLMSCNHVSTTNVNSSTANANISPTPLSENSLKAKVKALENEPLGAGSLGYPSARESENVSEIIAAGEKAVPFLVEALNEEKKRILVGYAAFCLRKIKSDKGKEPAVRLYKTFYKKRSRLTDDEPFAFNELTSYLKDISALPKDMLPLGLRQR